MLKILLKFHHRVSKTGKRLKTKNRYGWDALLRIVSCRNCQIKKVYWDMRHLRSMKLKFYSSEDRINFYLPVSSKLLYFLVITVSCGRFIPATNFSTGMGTTEQRLYLFVLLKIKKIDFAGFHEFDHL